jgi:hypothetical protein
MKNLHRLKNIKLKDSNDRKCIRVPIAHNMDYWRIWITDYGIYDNMAYMDIHIYDIYTTTSILASP